MYGAFKLCISYQKLYLSKVSDEFGLFYYDLPLLFEIVNHTNKIFQHNLQLRAFRWYIAYDISCEASYKKY